MSLANPPRRVSDQELRDLIDTPIIQVSGLLLFYPSHMILNGIGLEANVGNNCKQAALEMGIELGKVKSALQRKIQQTGQPFLTTESLLEAVLGRDAEYESDPDTDYDEENDEEEDVMPRRPHCALKSLNVSLFSGAGSVGTSEAGSSSSAEHSSGEESPTSSVPPNVKQTASRSNSGDSDSGLSTMSSENGEENRLETLPTLSENPGISNTSDTNSKTTTSTLPASEAKCDEDALSSKGAKKGLLKF